MKRLVLLLPLLPLALSLGGCDQLGIETPAKIEAARTAEGQAIGSACRQSMRALEDCYGMNPRASKAAIFAGWKDMDQYMRDNNIPGIPPAASAAASDAGGGDDSSQASAKGSDKGSDKSARADKADKAGTKTDKPASK